MRMKMVNKCVACEDYFLEEPIVGTKLCDICKEIDYEVMIYNNSKMNERCDYEFSRC